MAALGRTKQVEVFLIEADHPGAFSQKRTRLGIDQQNRACPFEEGVGIMDMLLGVIAPGTKEFGFEPTTYRGGRDAWKGRALLNAIGQIGTTPVRERDLVLARQTTSGGSDLSRLRVLLLQARKAFAWEFFGCTGHLVPVGRSKVSQGFQSTRANTAR